MRVARKVIELLGEDAWWDMWSLAWTQIAIAIGMRALGKPVSLSYFDTPSHDRPLKRREIRLRVRAIPTSPKNVTAEPKAKPTERPGGFFWRGTWRYG